MDTYRDLEAEQQLVGLITEMIEQQRKLFLCDCLVRLTARIQPDDIDTTRINNAIEVTKQFAHSLVKREDVDQVWTLAHRVTRLSGVTGAVHKAVGISSPENVADAAKAIRSGMVSFYGDPPRFGRSNGWAALRGKVKEIYEQISLAEWQINHGPRIAGLHAGSMWMSDDFDDELPDEFWFGEDSDGE